MAKESQRSDGQERRRADKQSRQDRARSDRRFKQIMREFRQDRSRREAEWRKLLGEPRSKPCGLLILAEKTLNYATRVAERTERKRGA